MYVKTTYRKTMLIKHKNGKKNNTGRLKLGNDYYYLIVVIIIECLLIWTEIRGKHSLSNIIGEETPCFNNITICLVTGSNVWRTHVVTDLNIRWNKQYRAEDSTLCKTKMYSNVNRTISNVSWYQTKFAMCYGQNKCTQAI